MKKYPKESDYEIYFRPQTKDLSIKYLKKFFLPEKEYKAKWKGIQEKIFSANFAGLPDYMFNNSFRLFPVPDIGLFGHNDFNQLINCMKSLGENYFVIIEDCSEYSSLPPLNFRYPTHVEFEEIIPNKNVIEGLSAEINRPVRDFYVFGESGKWGRYVANDYNDGLGMEFVGVIPEVESYFTDYISISEQEIIEIRMTLPLSFYDRLHPNVRERIMVI